MKPLMSRKEIVEFRARNKADRLWFVDYWAEYVRTHPDEDWSRQQADFINSILRTANQDVELYKKVKGI